MERLTRDRALLDLMFIDAEEIVKDVKIRSRLGCSNCALVEFVILRNTGLAKRGVRTLKFKGLNFRLFKELLNKISWEEVLRDKGAEQSSVLCEDAFLRGQELSILQNKNAGGGDRKLAWLGKHLLVKLWEKKGKHSQ